MSGCLPLQYWGKRIAVLNELIRKEEYPACTFMIRPPSDSGFLDTVAADPGLAVFYACCDGGDFSRFNVYTTNSLDIQDDVMVFGVGQQVGLDLVTGCVVSRFNSCSDWVVIAPNTANLFGELLAGNGRFTSEMWRDTIIQAERLEA
jgi:hypothetical protein